jgi:hypothetical protein
MLQLGSSLGRSRARCLLAAGLVALLLQQSPARAQVPGDSVRVETTSGTLTGLLVDRLPAGYLLRVGESTSVVPYGSVKAITRIEAQPGPPPQAAPPPAPSAPVVVVLPPAPPPAPPAPQAWPAPRPVQTGLPDLVEAGRWLTGLGVFGVLTGAVMTPVGYVLKSNNTCHDASGSIHFQCEYGHGSAIFEAGLLTLGASSAVLVGGIVMIVSGRSYRGTAMTTVPTLLVAPRGATLQWSF